MVRTDMDAVYQAQNNLTALQVALRAGEFFDINNPEFVRTYDTSAIVDWYPGESPADQKNRVAGALKSTTKTDLFETNTNDIINRQNHGEQNPDPVYFATLESQYQSIKEKGSKKGLIGSLKQSAVSFLGGTMPAEEVTGLGTVQVYRRQQQPQNP